MGKLALGCFVCIRALALFENTENFLLPSGSFYRLGSGIVFDVLNERINGVPGAYRFRTNKDTRT